MNEDDIGGKNYVEDFAKLIPMQNFRHDEKNGFSLS